MANADLPEEEERLAAALRALGWSETTAVANDTFAVLRAGLGSAANASTGPWGVAVTCGAGINCVGVDPAGRTTGYLALGEISGDWGGGFGLGQAALWWAVRAEDGRGPQTALREAVAAHFGVPTVRDVTIGIHLGKINEEALMGTGPGAPGGRGQRRPGRARPGAPPGGGDQRHGADRDAPPRPDRRCPLRSCSAAGC